MKSVRIPLPPRVAYALERLRRAGFLAYAVGGCVRDSLCGREPNDWDITTSATPEEMQTVFSDLRTVETGLKHGTLTVLVERTPLEITTFREDGEYLDNRHPSSVAFSRSLDADLSRRDFTVNAMAYHPDEGLVDLFGGREDLKARVIRCVGEPERRFSEDGLRILRALRFASVLDFSIDPATQEAIHRCSCLLLNISRERIREEFFKLLTGPGAVRILREYTDVVAVFLPEILPSVGYEQYSRYHAYDVWEHTLRAIEASPRELLVRLALLFHDLGKPAVKTEDAEGWHFKGHAAVSRQLCEEALRRLATDHATLSAVLQLVELHDRECRPEERAVKRLMQKLSDENISRLMEIQRADRIAHAEGYDQPPAHLAEIPRVVERIRREGACLTISGLTVGGEDLMALGIPRGPLLGKILSALLDAVVDERCPNEKACLLAEAKRLATQFTEER